MTVERGNVVEDLTIAGVCRALGWTPESIDNILAGGQPEIALTDVMRLLARRDPVALSYRMDELEARVRQLEAQLGQVHITGLGGAGSPLAESLIRAEQAAITPDEAAELRRGSMRAVPEPMAAQDGKPGTREPGTPGRRKVRSTE